LQAFKASDKRDSSILAIELSLKSIKNANFYCYSCVFLKYCAPGGKNVLLFYLAPGDIMAINM
jgi:hypothetical protein